MPAGNAPLRGGLLGEGGPAKSTAGGSPPDLRVSAPHGDRWPVSQRTGFKPRALARRRRRDEQHTAGVPSAGQEPLGCRRSIPGSGPVCAAAVEGSSPTRTRTRGGDAGCRTATRVPGRGFDRNDVDRATTTQPK